MALEITISPHGSAQLVRTMDEVATQTSRTHSFVGWSSQMERTDAFRGFLELFRGTYSSAHQDLMAGLEQAHQAAFDLEDAIGDARRDVLRTDAEVSRHHHRLEVGISMIAPGVGDSLDIPRGSDSVRRPAALVNTV